MTAPTPIVTGHSHLIQPSGVAAPYEFVRQMGVGRDGERAAWALLAEHGHLATPFDDQSNPVHQEQQRRGVDALISFSYHNPICRWDTTIEVKTDTYNTPNVAIELAQVRTDGTERLGCALSSEAEVWMYLRVPHRQALMLWGPAFREWARTLKPNREVRNRDPRNGKQYTAQVAIVPMTALEDAGVFLDGIYTIPEHIAQSLDPYRR